MRELLLLPLALLVLGTGPALADAEEEAWIAMNLEQLRGRLIHPDSAQTRGVFISRKAGVPVVCGEVNTLIAAGEETGFEPFIGAGSLGVFLPFDVDDFAALWGHFCR